MIELVLVVLVGVVSLIYLYLRHSYRYWQSRGVVQPPVDLGFGHFREVFLGDINPGLVYDRIYKTYTKNDAVGVYELTTPKLLVRNLDLVKRVMISDFSSFHDNEFYVTKKLDPNFYLDPFCLRGDEWKQGRSVLVTSVTANRLKEMFPLMKEVVTRLDSYINEQSGMDFESKDLATLFMMDNVSSTVFGISSNCFADSKAPFREMGDIIMKDQLVSWWKTRVMFIVPKIRDFLGMRFIPATVNNYIEKMVEEVIDHRTKNNVTRNDIMQYFMKKSTGGLPEIVGHGMTFFLEGFETSSMAGGMALYEIALNPKVQQKLYEEIKDAFGEKFDPDYDTLNNLPYLDKVILETQRKYPVMYVFLRLCTKPTSVEVDGKPLKLEPGTPVAVPVYSIHYDPKYYPVPEVFDPNRFDEDVVAARPPNTYMPFGDGPRMCPGYKFAITQVKLFIANMVYKYRILCTEKTPKKLTLSSGSFMVVFNEEKWIRVEPRK